MGLIKEPLDVDFYVDSRPLKLKEELLLKAFIKAEKAGKRIKIIQKKKVEKEIKNI